MFFYDLKEVPFEQQPWLQWISTGFLACAATFVISHIFFGIISQSFLKLRFKDKVEWNERIVSNVHAVYAVIACIVYLKTYNTTNVFGSSFLADNIIMTSFGYFIWDLFAILIFREMFTKLTLLHHTVAFILFPVTVWNREGAIVLMQFILMEITTPFVNQRWFLDKSHMKESTLYFANGITMFISFFFFRILFTPFMLYFMYLHRSEARGLNRISQLTFTMGLILQFSFNSYWFYLIAKGLYKAIKTKNEKLQ